MSVDIYNWLIFPGTHQTIVKIITVRQKNPITPNITILIIIVGAAVTHIVILMKMVLKTTVNVFKITLILARTTHTIPKITLKEKVISPLMFATPLQPFHVGLCISYPLE